MGENGNVQEAGCEVKEGQCEMSKLNKRLLEGHASEKRGEVGRSCLLFSKARQWYLYGSKSTGTVCTLCTRVSKQGKKRLKRVKFKLTWQQTTRRRTIISLVFKFEVNEYIGLLCDSGRNIEKMAM